MRATQVGPQAREDLMRELQAQVEASVSQGAEIVLGGKPLERRGYFYPPTILAGVKPGMRAYDEELFGPVASVITVQDLDHGCGGGERHPLRPWGLGLDPGQAERGGGCRPTGSRGGLRKRSW